MVTRLDADVGRLLARLAELNLDRNTLVVFTSDNGPHREGGADPDFFRSSGGLRGIKRDLYEGGIRVPFIARWTNRIRAGQTNDHPLAFWDVLPTFAQLAGARVPRDVDGISFVPALRGARQPTHDYLYWEFYEGGFMQAARAGRWKALRRITDAAPELYDLASDPAERHNVAAQHPDVVTSMNRIFATARTESKIWQTSPPNRRIGFSRADH